MVTWGLGGLGEVSYRTLLARLSDDFKKKPAKTVLEAATRWVDQFWTAYDPAVQPFRALNAKAAHDPNAAPNQAMRTKDEEEQFNQRKDDLGVGFCIGGYVEPSRDPEAHVMIFDPLQTKPAPTKLPMTWNFWGAPNMIQRLMLGRDGKLRDDILASGKWNGTAPDLDKLLSQYTLGAPNLPIRDAIDFTHACIASTIKAMKFSNLAQICGGPIEIAVITTDRRFRWVHHKEWDAAIMEGVPA